MGKPADVERPVILAEYFLKEAPKSPKGDFKPKISRCLAPFRGLGAQLRFKEAPKPIKT